MNVLVNRPIFAGVLLLAVAVGVGATWVVSHRAAAVNHHPHPTSPDAALSELKAGNQRYINCKRIESIDTSNDAAMRHELFQAQHPFAAVLCCSDSRVCPEFIFDQSPGSLFEIRNAGNVVDDDVLASVEYAIEHLHIPLVVVMGHRKCGAIQAVHDANGQPLPEHLGAIQTHMHDLAEEVHLTHADNTQACLDRLSDDNALFQTTALLNECPLLQDAVEHGKARVVTMSYDIDSGEAQVLTPTR